MGAKKKPVFNNANVDGEGMSVELELPDCEAIQLKIDFEDIYYGGFGCVTDEFESLNEQYLGYVGGSLEGQCIEIISNKLHIPENDINLEDDEKRPGFKETLDKFFDCFDTAYREYWKRRRNSELIYDIKHHILSLAWFQLLDTKQADKIILSDGNEREILKLHYLSNDLDFIDDTIIDLLKDKIGNMFFSIMKINEIEDEEKFDIEDIINTARKMKTENDYEKRNYYFDECFNNIPRNRPLEDTWE